jgi:hypothetical protein
MPRRSFPARDRGEIQEDLAAARDRPMSHEQRNARRNAEIRRRLGCPYLSPAEAAVYIGCSEKSLAEARVKGNGPTYRDHFGIAYHIDDIEAWSLSRRRVSTSDLPAQGAEEMRKR